LHISLSGYRFVPKELVWLPVYQGGWGYNRYHLDLFFIRDNKDSFQWSFFSSSSNKDSKSSS